jgi:GTP-binding protein YchF
VDPLRDLEDLETELILSDLMVIEKRLERLDKDRKKIKNPELDREFELLAKCKTAVENNQPLRQLELDPDDEKRLRGFQFLSQKPMLYVLNLGEEDAGRLHDREREYREGPLAGRANAAVTAICGKVEAELAELPRDEQREYLASYGLNESGLERLISATYSLLGLMSFLTAGEDECRAWQVPANSRAQEAAGAIHSDLEKHFIRAETIRWDQLLEAGSEANARAKGTLRLEGKDYIVQDGDVMHIRHSG